MRSYYAKINGKASMSKASVIKQEATQPSTFKLSSKGDVKRKGIDAMLGKEKPLMGKRTASKAGLKTVPQPFNLSSGKRQKLEITKQKADFVPLKVQVE